MLGLYSDTARRTASFACMLAIAAAMSAAGARLAGHPPSARAMLASCLAWVFLSRLLSGAPLWAAFFIGGLSPFVSLFTRLLLAAIEEMPRNPHGIFAVPKASLLAWKSTPSARSALPLGVATAALIGLSQRLILGRRA